MVLIFLDFDGVMHPAGCEPSEHFCHRDAFEAVMREFPEVRIVITSTWRHAYPLAEMKKLFSADIAARIVGKTPTWEDDDDEHIRHREIRKLLQHPSAAGAQWVAIDDSEFEFPDGCPNLLRCDSSRGLDAAAVDELRRRVRALV